MDARYLKQFRRKTGLNQKDFASVVGMSQSMVSQYERGNRKLSVDTFVTMKKAFGYDEAEKERLRVLIDYVRITFKSVRDLDFFCTMFLHCKFKDFRSVTSGLLNYNHVWQRGNIWIFDFADKFDTGNYQITLQMSGQGCREFECVLAKYDLTWFDFFKDLDFSYRATMNVTRLDIAIDELYLGKGNENEQFELSDMITKYYNQELYFEKLRRWNYIGGGSLNFEDEQDREDNRQGISLYFGSRQSELYFNFYEKRYERAKEDGISVEDALCVYDEWNRFEIRLAQKKANAVVQEYLQGIDLGEIARGLINANFDVYDGQNEWGAYLADKKWQNLFGGSLPLVLSTKPEPYSIEKTIKWLSQQVAPSLALVSEYDKITQEDYLAMILNSGEITERGQQMLDDIKNSLR